MKALALILTILALSACGPVQPPKTLINLTEVEKDLVMRGYNLLEFSYDDTDRLSLMPPPVTVITKSNPESHGVFRDKYQTYVITVSDGRGRMFTLSDSIQWASVHPGDILKGVPK